MLDTAINSTAQLALPLLCTYKQYGREKKRNKFNKYASKFFSHSKKLIDLWFFFAKSLKML